MLAALRIWDGGLGIWGAISLGFAGALYGCRKHGLDFPRFADALAPGIVLAQAIGRIGNWFNQELFGRPTTLPWALEIDVAHRPNGYAAIGLYHPTFLYELIGCVAIAVGILGWLLLRDADPVALPKACKNAVELEGIRAAHRRDGAAVSRFLAWLARESRGGKLREIEVSDRLQALREETQTIGRQRAGVAGAGFAAGGADGFAADASKAVTLAKSLASSRTETSNA